MVKDDLVSRAQVLVEWNISLSSLLRANLDVARNGGRSGREAMYRRVDVDAFARRKGLSPRSTGASLSGETIASMFELLAKGVSPDQIVVQTRLHPDVVDVVIERWQRMRRDVLVMSHEEVTELLSVVGVHIDGQVREVKQLLGLVRGASRGGEVSSVVEMPVTPNAPAPNTDAPISHGSHPLTPTIPTVAPDTVAPDAAARDTDASNNNKGGSPSSESAVTTSPSTAAEADPLAGVRLTLANLSSEQLEVLATKPHFLAWAKQELSAVASARCSFEDAQIRIRQKAERVLSIAKSKRPIGDGP